MSIYDIQVKDSKNEVVNMGDFRGKVLLIVNTASECGFTKQFDGLEALYQKYKDQDFVILGFPCNQFGGQEPGDAEEAAQNCRLNYGVTFPMLEKVEVNGENTHPIFKYLKSETNGFLGDAIKWNFTKFLVDKEGNVVSRFSPQKTPAQIEDDITSLLKQ